MSLSRFLKIPDAAFTPALLHRQVFFYVIEEFHSQIENLSYPDGCDAEKLVQYLMDKSTHRFRMYGSAQELLENVKIFTNFPASSHVFKVDKTPYTTPPTIFYSMKNEKYICKSDLFVILQNMGYQDSDPRKLLLAMAVHLKSEEEKMGDRVEFVRFDEKVLEEIEKEIKRGMADRQSVAQHSQMLAAGAYNIEDVMRGVKAQYPSLGDMSENSEFYKYMKNLLENGNAGNLPKMDIFTEKGGLFIQAMSQVGQKWPEMFIPYSVTNKNYSNPITVRVFEDGDQRFVLKVELSNALFLKGVITVPLTEKDRAFHTMSMEQVLKNFDIKNIEFIRYPIHRAKHRMVPVKIFNSPAAHFTVLAVDGLFEFLRETIFSLKIFQSPKNASDLLLETTSIFESHQKFPYFLTIDRLNDLKNMGKEKLGNVPKIGVRNAKKDGFTVQNLKNELKHLGLLETFPEIQKHVEDVYSEVVKMKKDLFLRTCDLFDAIEHCQLNCVFEKFEFLKKFLHNQKGCHRIYGYKCEECDKIQKAPEVATSSSEFKNPEFQVQKTSDGPKTSEFKKSSKASSIPEDPMTSSESKIQKTSSSEVIKAPESKNLIQKTSNNFPETGNQKTSDLKAPESKTSPESQNQKTSSNCEKCYRVFEMLNETKNELKNLKSTKEREFEEFKKIQKEKLDEKEAENQGLKEIIEKKNEENQNLNGQISTLKISISQLKTKNSRQKEEFQEAQNVLEEKNSKLEKELRNEKTTTSGYLVEILEKNRKLEEFKESEIRMKAKNEENEKLIRQLLDKLDYSNPASSEFWKNSEMTSSRNQQICEICWNPTDNHQSVKCQKCRRPFHSQCASDWLKSYKMCPSCDGEFQ